MKNVFVIKALNKSLCPANILQLLNDNRILLPSGSGELSHPKLLCAQLICAICGLPPETLPECQSLVTT